MSNFEIYAQSIDDAVLTYSATEDANFPDTNTQDRNIKTFMKDSAMAVENVSLIIDLVTARACDFVLFGNSLFTADNAVKLDLLYGTADNGADFENNALDNELPSTTLDDNFFTFTSQTKRYWKLDLVDEQGAGNDLINLQIGTIFLGTHWNWAHEPELTLLEDSGHKVTVNESAGGSRFAQIANTIARRKWDIPLEYIIAAEKTKHETFRDQIFPDSRGGLSRYPFYWSPDNGTTIYYSRYQGSLNLEQQAYQVWKTVHPFVEEL